MKKWLAMLITFTALFGYALAFEPSVELFGNKHKYLIPKQLINSKSSVPYPGKLVGDKSESLSLLIPSKLLKLDGLKGNNISLMVFTDKDYENEVRLENFALRMIDGAEQVQGDSHGPHYFVFKSKLGDHTHSYFLNFDPYAPKSDVPEGKFFASLVEAVPFKLDEFRVTPKPTCAIHTMLDGFALEVSAVGTACSVESFKCVMESVTQLFLGWRVE